MLGITATTTSELNLWSEVHKLKKYIRASHRRSHHRPFINHKVGGLISDPCS